MTNHHTGLESRHEPGCYRRAIRARFNLGVLSTSRNVQRGTYIGLRNHPFHPQAPWLYVSASYGLTAFNIETGETRELWGHEEFAANLTLDSVGRRLIGARHKLWTNQPDLRWLTCVDITNPNTPVREWERVGEYAELVAFFPDGTRFAAFEEDSRITIRMADTGEIVRAFKSADHAATNLRFRGSGETLVVASTGGSTSST